MRMLTKAALGALAIVAAAGATVAPANAQVSIGIGPFGLYAGPSYYGPGYYRGYRPYYGGYYGPRYRYGYYRGFRGYRYGPRFYGPRRGFRGRF